MKLWLWIIVVFLFITSVVIGVLQHSEVQYRIGEWHLNNGDRDSAYHWFGSAGKSSHQKSCEYLSDILLKEKKEAKYELVYLRWLYVESKSYIFDIKYSLTYDFESLLMGLEFFDGIDKPKNVVEGCAWFRVAESKFSEDPYDVTLADITLNLNIIKCAELEMKPEEIKQSKVLAAKILKNMKKKKPIYSPKFR